MRNGFGIFRSPFCRPALLLKLALALIVVALLLVLLLPRIGPRRDLYDASQVFTPCLMVPGDGSEHRAVPGCTGESRIGSRRAAVRFNSAGLRGPEYAPRPEPGVLRVLVLGSSNMLGPGVQEEATFPRRLEEALGALGRKAEVLNAGMVGYCTAQAAFRLRELLERYSPHLVLYQFVQGACPLFDGAWGPHVEFEDGEPRRIDRSPFDKNGAFRGLNRFLYGARPLFFLWLTAADQWRKAAFSRVYTAPATPAERAAAYMEPSLSFLSYMRAAAARSGAELVVFSYRMKPFTQSVPAHLHQWLARALAQLVRPIDFSHHEIFALLERNGFRYVYPDFPTKDLLMAGDTHLNEEGLRRLAGATAAALAKSEAAPAVRAERKPRAPRR